MLIERLNPLHWFLPFRALIRRELLTTLRGLGAIVCLVLLMLATIGVVALGYPETNTPLFHISEAANQVFVALSYVLLTAILLFLPVFGAASMAAEREQETFEQLYLSLVWPIGIVTAKLLNSIGLFVLMLIASLPALSLVLFLVGIEVQQVAAVLAVLLATCAACGGLGVLAGAVQPSVVRATVLGNFLAGCFAFGYMLTLFVASTVVSGLRRNFWDHLEYTQPYVLIARILNAGGAPGGGYTLHVSVYCSMAALVCILSLALARTRISHAGKGAELPQPGMLARVLRRKHARTNPCYRFPDKANPVFRRELFSASRTHRGLPWRTMAFHAILSFVYTAGVAFQMKQIPQSNYATFHERFNGIFTPYLLFPVFLAGSYAASLFTKERLRGNLDSLHLTMLDSRTIVTGKARATFAILMLIAGAQLVGSFAFWIVAGAAHAEHVLLFYAVTSISVAVCVGYALAQSVVIGAFCKRATSALLLTYMSYVLTFGALSLMLAIFARSRGDFLFFLSPYLVWLTQFQTDPAHFFPWAIAMAVYAVISVALVAFAGLVYEDFVRHDG